MLIKLLSALTLTAFLFVIFTLIMGAKSMASKTEGASKTSNVWMQRRVIGQFLAIGFLALTFWVKNNTTGG